MVYVPQPYVPGQSQPQPQVQGQGQGQQSRPHGQQPTPYNPQAHHQPANQQQQQQHHHHYASGNQSYNPAAVPPMTAPYVPQPYVPGAPVPAAVAPTATATAPPQAAQVPTPNYAGHSIPKPPVPSAPTAEMSAAPVQTSAPPPARANVPDFSMALDVPPPPPQPSQPDHTGGYRQDGQYGQYGAGEYSKPPVGGPSYNSAPMATATATAVPTVTGMNSSTYSGGPTGGLISEGNPSHCHRISYEIKGHEMQLVEIELEPSMTVIAEAGAMMFLEDGITFEAKFGDGSTPKEGFFKKLLSAGGRLLTGESLFLTHFTNKGYNGPARVAFAAPYPGSIVPINMANIGQRLICQKDAFLCAARGTKLSIHFNKKIGSGLFGGEGFILQRLEGDGMAFVHAGGTVIKRELHGGKIRLDTGCLVAFTDGIVYDIQFVSGLKSMFFGGEGLFLATLQGTGTVWMQSLPFSRMADRIIQHAPSAGGRRQGEGSALTGQLGDILDGDGFGFNF